MRIRIAQRFDAPAERVFDAWITPAIARRWLFAMAARPLARASIDARAGRAFTLERGGRERWKGRFLAVERPRRLAFEYTENGGTRRSRVQVEIVPRGGACELTLVHAGVAPGDALRVDGRWAGMLYGLAETLRKSARGGKRASRKLPVTFGAAPP